MGVSIPTLPMNATALSGLSFEFAQRPRAQFSRNTVIGLVVVALHVGAIWALQSGLMRHEPEIIVPVEVLAQLIEAPQPQIDPTPPAPPAPPAPPTPDKPPEPRMVKPAPVAPKKTVIKPAAQPPAPLAIADPTPSPNAPAGSLALGNDIAAKPGPVETAPPAPPAPAASPSPPTVQLPSSNADYLQNPKPAYPPLSRRLGEQGKVVVRVLIGANGQPQKAELRQSSGFDRLDQAALSTVMKWRYVPGKRGGVAEDMWFSVPINFVLE